MKHEYFYKERYVQVNYHEFKREYVGEMVEEIDSCNGCTVTLTVSGKLLMIESTCGPVSEVTPDLEWSTRFYVSNI